MTTPVPLTTEEAAAAGLLPASYWQQEPVGLLLLVDFEERSHKLTAGVASREE